MFTVKIIPPLAELKIKDDLLKNASDFKSIFEIMGKYAVGIARIKYLSGQRPHNLGEVSGRLIKSIHSSINHDIEGCTIMKFGTDVFYGKFHEQLETDGKSRGRLPKRPFLVPAIIDAFTLSPEKILADTAWRKVIKANFMKIREDLKKKNKRGKGR